MNDWSRSMTTWGPFQPVLLPLGNKYPRLGRLWGIVPRWIVATPNRFGFYPALSNEIASFSQTV
jgi:hypothetical protein